MLLQLTPFNDLYSCTCELKLHIYASSKLFYMLIISTVSQELTTGDRLWVLFPVICCFLIMGITRSGGSSQNDTVRESWYMEEDINTTFKVVEETTNNWKNEARKNKSSESPWARLKGIFSRGSDERYVLNISTPPRLLKLNDKYGPIFFELTEVIGGGTVVNTTYNSLLKTKFANFRASQPVKVPANPVGNRCVACGKPLLPEFNLCPYCGEKVIKE